MAKSTHRSAPVRQEAPAVAPVAESPPAPAVEAPVGAGMAPGWRTALFIWATAFVGLAAYEVLRTLVGFLGRLF